jgi:hypothetical protein
MKSLPGRKRVPVRARRAGGKPSWLSASESWGRACPCARRSAAPLRRRRAVKNSVDPAKRAVAALARFPNGGLIVTRTTEVMAHGDLIVALAARGFFFTLC